MIHAKPLYTPGPEGAALAGLEIHLDRQGIQEFQKLLNRALNTAEPKANEYWLQLAGKIEEAFRIPLPPPQ